MRHPAFELTVRVHRLRTARFDLAREEVEALEVEYDSGRYYGPHLACPTQSLAGKDAGIVVAKRRAGVQVHELVSTLGRLSTHADVQDAAHLLPTGLRRVCVLESSEMFVT